MFQTWLDLHFYVLACVTGPTCRYGMGRARDRSSRGGRRVQDQRLAEAKRFPTSNTHVMYTHNMYVEHEHTW